MRSESPGMSGVGGVKTYSNDAVSGLYAAPFIVHVRFFHAGDVVIGIFDIFLSCLFTSMYDPLTVHDRCAGSIPRSRSTFDNAGSGASRQVARFFFQ